MEVMRNALPLCAQDHVHDGTGSSADEKYFRTPKILLVTAAMMKAMTVMNGTVSSP